MTLPISDENSERSDNVHTFGHLQVYFMAHHHDTRCERAESMRKAFWLPVFHAGGSFVRSVSSRFLWYLSLWLTWNRHYVSVVLLSLSLFLSHSRIIFYAIYGHIVIRYLCLCLFSCCKIIRFSHFEMHQSTTTFTRTTKRNHLVPSMRKVISVNTIKLSTLKAKTICQINGAEAERETKKKQCLQSEISQKSRLRWFQWWWWFIWLKVYCNLQWNEIGAAIRVLAIHNGPRALWTSVVCMCQ